MSRYVWWNTSMVLPRRSKEQSAFILPADLHCRCLLILQDNSVHVKFSVAAFSDCQKRIVHFYYVPVSQRMSAFRESENDEMLLFC